MAEVIRGTASVSFPSSIRPINRAPGSKYGSIMVSFRLMENGLSSNSISLSPRSGNSFSNSQLHGSFLNPWEHKTTQLQRGVREADKFPFQVRAAQTCMPRLSRWWEKGVTSNMVEVHSAQELIDSLLTAGDKLVVLDFYAPGCGACRSVHPKICQFAEKNPDVKVVKVNYEENKSMCYSLRIHVLPFFQFYRGAAGRLCSFSCTNATIKKFRDALEKHSTPRCSLGPPRGLGEDELLALSKNKSLSFVMPEPAETLRKEVPFAVRSEHKADDLALVAPGKNPDDMAPVGPSRKSDLQELQELVGSGRS